MEDDTQEHRQRRRAWEVCGTVQPIRFSWVYKESPKEEKTLPRSPSRPLLLLIGAAALAAGLTACGSSDDPTAKAPADQLTSGAPATTTATPAPTSGLAATSPAATLPSVRPTPPKTGTAPSTTVASFVGLWSGHTRQLTISAAGVGQESVSAGCCDRAIDLTFQLSNERGTATQATATATVTRVHRYEGSSLPKVTFGQKGSVTISGGVITDHLTGVFYCNAVEMAKSTCGA